MLPSEIERYIQKELTKIDCKCDLEFFKIHYSEPQRFYHNWNHILDMVEKAIKLGNEYKGINLLLAILFHDIVYIPTKDDNEFQSAFLFLTYYPYCTLISQAILDTKYHIAKDNCPVSELLCELDMSILYDDMEAFMKYEKGIRLEYFFVPIETYKKNRIKFLKDNKVSEDKIEYIKNLYN